MLRIFYSSVSDKTESNLIMASERKLLLETYCDNRETLTKELKTTLTKPTKDANRSEEARKRGNNLFLGSENHSAKIHKEIFLLYNKSVAYAPNDSEQLASALANRSALLLHIGRYEDSIKDIEKALKIAQSKILKVKLLCRQIECIRRSGSEDHEKLTKEVTDSLDEIDDKKIKKALEKNLNKALNIKIEKSLQNSEVKRSKSNKLKCTEVLNNVSVQYSEKFGRFLVAKRDFNPGEVVFTEKPYVTVLNSDSFYTNCDNCMRVAWSAVPCTKCGWAVYCSEICKKEAWANHHDVECKIVPFIGMTSPSFLGYYHVCVRMLIMGIKECCGLDELRMQLDEVDNCEGEFID